MNVQNQKRILIMTVYAPSAYNEHWYKLQKHFIKRNTLVPHDFKIIVNNIDTELFEKDEVVRVNDSNIGHPKGVDQILEYMRNDDSYSGYLLLDSDCFPVGKGWYEILDKQMGRLNKTIAAPIRYENLDIFPHPCAVYMSPEGVKNPKVNFNYAKVKNLLGDSINEVGGLMPEISDDVLPMLRTNRVNLHPVAAGIYHHLFYHHGAGSRGFDFRLLKMYEYYNHWVDIECQPEYGAQLMNTLVNDPDGFIEKLMYAY